MERKMIVRLFAVLAVLVFVAHGDGTSLERKRRSNVQCSRVRPETPQDPVDWDRNGRLRDELMNAPLSMSVEEYVDMATKIVERQIGKKGKRGRGRQLLQTHSGASLQRRGRQLLQTHSGASLQTHSGASLRGQVASKLRALDVPNPAEAVGAFAAGANAFANIASMTFDRSYLDRAANFIQARYEQFEMVAGQLGYQLIGMLSSAVVQLENAETSFRAVATTVKSQVRLLRLITDGITRGAPLYDFELDRPTIEGRRFQGLLRVLLRNLQTFIDVTNEAQDDFGDISASALAIAGMANITAVRFRSAADRDSEPLQTAIMDQRSRAYGSCAGICGVTCALTFVIPFICGACVGTCFGIAAGVIEGEIVPGLMEDFATAAEELRNFGTIFDNFAIIALNIRNRSAFDRDLASAIGVQINTAQTQIAIGQDLDIAEVFLDVIDDGYQQVELAAQAIEDALVSSGRVSAVNLPPLPPLQTPDLDLALQDRRGEFEDLGNEVPEGYEGQERSLLQIGKPKNRQKMNSGGEYNKHNWMRTNAEKSMIKAVEDNVLTNFMEAVNEAPEFDDEFKKKMIELAQKEMGK